MNILRRVVSFIVFVAGLVVLIAVIMGSAMGDVWHAFSVAFSSNDFQTMVDALGLMLNQIGIPVVVTMLGFLGFTIPNGK